MSKSTSGINGGNVHAFPYRSNGLPASAVDSEPIETVIAGLPGVDFAGQAAGMFTIIEHDGATIVEVEVMDSHGGRARMSIGYAQLASIMMALGAAGSKL